MTDGYKIKRVLTWVANTTKGLPAEYQEVEYIESTGTQHIDTLYNPIYGTEIYCKFSNSNTSAVAAVFGRRDNNGYYEYSLRNQGTSASAIRYNIMSANGISVTTAAQNAIVEFEYTKNSYKYGQTTGTISPSTSNITGINLIIFGLMGGSTVDSRKMSGKMRYFKIYENGVPVRDFVPCYRKADGVVGMYDVVNNQFYTNSGTGTFIKGNDVPSFVEKQIYPDTRWKPNANTLLYYPLTSDLVDVMGNGNTGTAHGNVTFNANPGATIGCHVQGQNSIYVTGLSLGVNGKSTVTLNYWANFISLNDKYASLVGAWGYNDSTEPTKLICESTQQLGCKGTNGNCYTDTSNNIALNSGYHNFGFAINNGTIKMYIDGQSVPFKGGLYQFNIGSVKNGRSDLMLGWGDMNSTGRSATGYISDYIVETIAWTDENFADYYKQTKSKHGL